MDERYDGTSRRRLLEAEALGAGAVLASGTLSTGPAAATEATHQNGRIDTEHLRFTVAVVPDTKYVDLDRGDPAPLTATAPVGLSFT